MVLKFFNEYYMNFSVNSFKEYVNKIISYNSSKTLYILSIKVCGIKTVSVLFYN